MYKTLSEKDKNLLLNSKGDTKYKMVGHQFVPLKGIGKQYCRFCGLVALNNSATNWCIDKGCNFSLHPQYKSAMKRLTKRK